jgi:chromosome segregation protein
VHLRSIKLRGFKSFPDPVEIRLEPGVAVVVGPNGSGKSNVADALVWAAGSQSTNELRAERPDDMLFAGSAGHEPASSCDVELHFDNEDGGFSGLEFSEIAIARRLHRGGEGQYLVNGAHVRRVDVVELLADVGLGPGTGSVVSQGKVEAILASRPEERRALVEDAAGLGRFKRRRHRAELKLARVEVQTERARDLEQEVAKRIRPLALQATAAERAEKLGVEIARLRAGLAALDAEELERRLAELDARSAEAASAREGVDIRLEAVLAERGQAEEALAETAGGGDGAAAALYRLRSARERLELRREAAAELLARVRTPPPPLRDGSLREQAQLAAERAGVLERLLEEREGLPPAARALAEEGARLALDSLEVERGLERAVAAALGAAASALVVDDADAGLALLELARARGLGSLHVLVGHDPAELVARYRVVTLNELLGSPVAAVTREGFGFDPSRGELWFAGATAEALLLELEARHRALAAEAEELARRAAEASPRTREPDPRLVGAAERLVALLDAALARAQELDAPLRSAADRGSARAGELAAELRRLAAAEAELRREAMEAANAATALQVERARLEAELRDARRRLEEAHAEPAEGERSELADRLVRLERRRELLGNVNPFAKEEYEREKERLADLSAQREDLERSLAELEKLRRDLAETVERRFEETFGAVQRNFAEVAATLFPGGEGSLRLTEPEDGGEPGIEVELRPAGKRVTRLSLLSGGEKALGAISFLFALFLARPCPFYLLDEVEAALDDTNIGRFVELLRRFADRAQFIVITHQKRTMEAADVLYGVTMGGDGVSQIVSRRLPRDEAAVA